MIAAVAQKTSTRVHLFGIEIDPLTMSEAVNRLLEWTDEEASICRIVVTPNTDHVVQLQTSNLLRPTYASADLVVADGMPIVVASRLLGRPLPERVTGADLTPSLFAASTPQHPLKVYLFGAGDGVAERAAVTITRTWPGVQVVGTASPPLGFEKNPAENDRQIAAINAAAPDVLVIGLGAPKQELWAQAHRDRLRVKVALCVGATIDFLAGEKPRAPLWMRRCGLEWLHRLGSEPKRLFRRYAQDALIFPKLLWQEFRRPTGNSPLNDDATCEIQSVQR